MRIVFDKAESLRDMGTAQMRQAVNGGITLRKDGSGSTYSVKWLKDSKTFQVEKQDKSFWNAVKSWFSHGLVWGHTHTRAERIAEALNQRMAELEKAPFATLDSKNNEHHWTPERTGKKIGSVFSEKSAKREVFLYGFSQQRHNLKQSLAPVLQNQTGAATPSTTIDDYNADLGINWGLGFEDYLDILDEAKSGTLAERSGKAPRSSTREHRNWAEFLQANPHKLDITRHKDGTPDIGAEFFAKNLSTGDPNDYPRMGGPVRDAMQDIENDGKLPQGQRRDPAELRMALDAATEQIRGVLAMATDPQIPTTEKKAAYNKLTEDDKGCLDWLTTKAFFRKTSKLGLEFARSQGAPVAFSWRHPFYYEKLEDALREKPWKTLGGRGKFAEAITFSEMRKLARLEARGEAPANFRFVDKKSL